MVRPPQDQTFKLPWALHTLPSEDLVFNKPALLLTSLHVHTLTGHILNDKEMSSQFSKDLEGKTGQRYLGFLRDCLN